MPEIRGKVNTAICFAKAEEDTIAQLPMMCGTEMTKGSNYFIDVIGESADVIEVSEPIFNYKAG